MTHPCCALLDGHSEVLLFPRKIVLNGGTQAPHPFGIAVFENHVFFTDWTKMGVVRANRFNGSNQALLYRTAMRPGHVVVSHSVLQPVGKETHFQPVTSQIEFSGQRSANVSYLVSLLNTELYLNTDSATHSFSLNLIRYVYELILYQYAVIKLPHLSCPTVMNPCGRHNGGCQHICVLSHRSDNDGLGFRCKCRHGYDLQPDRRTCFSEFPLIESKMT